MSLTPINSLRITVELFANGTLLFTLASGTDPYRSGPPLLRGTDPSGTDRLGTVMRRSVYIGLRPVLEPVRALV